MGLLRSIWQLSTVVVAGPPAFLGLLAILEGRYPEGALFVGLAVAFAVVSEFAFVRLTGGTVLGLDRLRSDREADE